MKLYTIGHSNHSLENFLKLLEDNNIQVLIDVRTSPYSRFSPQFNKQDLEWNLSQRTIQYRYAGKKLGGRPTDPSCYKSGKLPKEGADYLHEVNYPAIMKKPWFNDGIDQLLQLSELQTTAIMCSEEDPAKCHRHHLIAKYLLAEFPEIEIIHIRGDGNVYNARSEHTTVDKPPADQLSFFN